MQLVYFTSLLAKRLKLIRMFERKTKQEKVKHTNRKLPPSPHSLKWHPPRWVLMTDALTDRRVSLWEFVCDRVGLHTRLPPFVYLQVSVCVCVSLSLETRGVDLGGRCDALSLDCGGGWLPPFPASLPHQATPGVQGTRAKCKSQAACVFFSVSAVINMWEVC